MASAAVEQILANDAECATIVLAMTSDGDVQVERKSTDSVGDVAQTLLPDTIAFVYGRVMLDEQKGGLEVESVGRRKLVLLTWLGAEVSAAQRGKAGEMRVALNKALPGLTVHVEVQATNAAEAEQATILQKVKTSSGAFYDNGAEGADQTVESVKAETAAPTAKAAPKGGRKLVKRAAS